MCYFCITALVCYFIVAVFTFGCEVGKFAVTSGGGEKEEEETRKARRVRRLQEHWGLWVEPGSDKFVAKVAVSKVLSQHFLQPLENKHLMEIDANFGRPRWEQLQKRRRKREREKERKRRAKEKEKEKEKKKKRRKKKRGMLKEGEEESEPLVVDEEDTEEDTTEDEEEEGVTPTAAARESIWDYFFHSDVRNFSRTRKKTTKYPNGYSQTSIWREKACVTCDSTDAANGSITKRFRHEPKKLRQTMEDIVESELREERGDGKLKLLEEKEMFALAAAERVVHEWMDYCVEFKWRRVVNKYQAVHFSDHRQKYPHLYMKKKISNTV